MNSQLQSNLQLFVENNQSLKGDFIWHDPMAKRLAALTYALEGKNINSEAIKECHRIIKDDVGPFSTFRGNMAVYIAASLSLQDNPRQLLAHTLEVYNVLKQEGFWASDYLVVTAYEIAVNTSPDKFAYIAQRSMEFYREMKANIRFHIGQDDYIFAAMLAMSGIDIHDGALKMRHLFSQLKSEFSAFIGRNSIVTLSQMLVLGQSTNQCIEHLLKLSKVLRKRKVRLDKSYTLPSLGVLGILAVDKNTFADDLIATRDYLRQQKGFGHWSITTQELLLYAVSLITNAYTGDANNSMKASVTTSVTNLIIAQQVAMIVAISVATSVAVASC